MRWHLVLAAVLPLGWGGCAPFGTEAPAITLSQVQGEALGTTWTVKWVGNEEAADQVVSRVEAALGAVDSAMSTWRGDSELSRVRSAEDSVVVSEPTYEVVAAALQLAEATGGAFDPTVQPLVELWGLHEADRQTLPTEAELAEAMAQVGWDRVQLGRDASGRPTVDAGGTALDLSAIAKGYAVDRVSWEISGLGIANHLIEVGGEVRAHGEGPSGAGWRLGVERPVSGAQRGAIEAVVQLVNGSMATSGDYRNVRVIEGQRVAHTLDPRTGRPTEGMLASVTVVAPDCTTADALATAVMVLGEEEGLALIESRPEIEALILVIDGDGFAQRRSSGMERWVVGP